MAGSHPKDIRHSLKEKEMKMLDFKPIEVTDKQWADPLIKMSNYKGSEYVFSNNYNWRFSYFTEVARFKDFYLVKSGKTKKSYLFPSGSGDLKEVVTALIEDAKARGEIFALRSITEETKAQLEAVMPDVFNFETNRDNADYIYLKDKLSTLAGKKLHGKRNHINRFKENNPNWVYEDITPENIYDCITMNKKWCKLMECNDSETLSEEVCAVKSSFRDFENLKLIGGLLRLEAGGDVIAYTIGSYTEGCDTVVVHIEKAFHEIQGAYPMINQQFVLSQCQDFTYINREDDLGEEGLRKAKLSYYPEIIEEKYIATLK